MGTILTQARRSSAILFMIGVTAWAIPSAADDGSAVQARIAADLANDQPVVIHLTVALCDNENQGIVPVPKALGNGQDPASNLYWGALYGVKTYLKRTAGWKVLDTAAPDNPHILQRAIFHATVKRKGVSVPIYIVADAWDGAHMKEALTAYLQRAAGHGEESVAITEGDSPTTLSAGGSAHLIAFVGHNGLMDFSLPSSQAATSGPGPRSALILACASKQYFVPHLEAAGAHPLLLTTGLMAPEAYSLDAAIRAWVSEGTSAAADEAAAKAYHQYQKCGMKGARRLFWTEE